jgi:hypothetical protein
VVFTRLRRRLPLGVLVVLAALCLLLAGITCTCVAIDHGKLALAPLAVGLTTAPVLEVWPALALVLIAAMSAATEVLRRDEVSPASLQRFLL